MDIKYKTLTKLTEEEIRKASRPKSAHTYGNEWRIWAWGIGKEMDGLDEASAKKLFEGMKRQYQTLELELKKERIRKMTATIKPVNEPKQPVRIMTENGENLFRMVGIMYVDNKCEQLSEQELKPYMDKLKVLYLHNNIKYIDGAVLRKCPKLKEINYLLNGENPYYEVRNNQLYDKRTKERLWP